MHDEFSMKHLYIHIPFCQTRCAYCDFNTFAHRDDIMPRYVAALVQHLSRMTKASIMPFANWHDRPADNQPWAEYAKTDCPAPLRRADLPATVFLGGGTPTALPLNLLEQVVHAAGDCIPLDQAEVTSEANPGTVLDGHYLRAMRSMGINRLSMGVQSLHDPTLRMLGRIHTASEARDSYNAARNAGFDNINLDFMFGLPGQDVAQWEASLREIVTWDVEHFALYSLIIEPSTPLAAQVHAGRWRVPNDDTTADMYERAMDILGSAGYVQYEISNWARATTMNPDQTQILPAHASRHNVAYWLNADYLGVGAGAHSHMRGIRWADERVLERFVAHVETDHAPIEEVTRLNANDVAFETMMMGLRLSSGVGFAHFAERCGRDMRDVYATTINDLVAQHLLIMSDAGVRLSPRGRMLGNSVFERFLLDDA